MMTEEETALLARVDALDKSEWTQRTAALFADAGTKWNPGAPYAIERNTTRGTINLGDVYMAIGDPTEYEFAIRAFGTFRIWRRIKETAWGKKFAPMYAEELSVKMKSSAIKDIVDLAKDTETKETTKLQALKFVVAGEWGLGKKIQVTASVADKKAKQVKNQVAEDLERIGLKVVK